MFNKILVATDGSSHANKALELAGNLAKVHEASLVIVHVLQHGRVPDSIMRMVENEHLVEQSRPYGARLAESARSLVAVMGKDAKRPSTPTENTCSHAPSMTPTRSASGTWRQCSRTVIRWTVCSRARKNTVST